MKKSSFLVGGALLLSALFTTSCKEIMSNLDEPVKSYMQIDNTDVVLSPGQEITRVATTISTEGVEYESSAPEVATVDSKTGKVTAVAIGETTITASVKANDYYMAGTQSYKVKVITIALDDTEAVIGVGDSEPLIATIAPEGGFGYELKWSSDNDAIVKVDASGIITAVAPGTANITADIAGVKAVCKVTAKAKVDLSAVSAYYIAEDGDILTGSTNYGVEIPDGATVYLSGVDIDLQNDNPAAINCAGDATIVLVDGSVNTAKSSINEKPGVQIGGEDKKLVIKGGKLGNGTLDALGGVYAAGIGNGSGQVSGDVEIQGGIITAVGIFSAGIGPDDDYPSSVGNITISGGEVTAQTQGYDWGWGYNPSNCAGIGSGVNKTCKNITISGGKVIAVADYHAAGIGCGQSGTCGDITINGGIITAIGSDYGAGIGCGSSAYNKATCGNITITDGEVTARGGQAAAGIGAGCVYDNDYANTCGNITITGGKVNAYCNSMFGAGIGSGLKWNSGFVNTSTCGDITISGGEVVATKGGSGMYDVGPGELASNPGIWTGAVGTVNVTVAIKDLNGNDATIYTPAPAAAPRRAKSGVSKLIAPYDSESKLTPMKK